MKGHNASAGALLGSFIGEIERLEDQKREIAQRIQEKKREAKRAGLDTKVMNQMLRERRMDAAERAEYQSLCEVYRAALGMLGGTPLGDFARKRLMGDEPEAEAPDAAQAQEALAPDLDGARDAGREAARAGKRVIDNPYIAGDPRRAAWDEGYCAESGSDGMEIPAAWRRKPKKKPEPEGQAEGPDEGEGSPAPEGEGEGEGEGNNAPEGEEGKGGNGDETA